MEVKIDELSWRVPGPGALAYVMIVPSSSCASERLVDAEDALKACRSRISTQE